MQKSVQAELRSELEQLKQEGLFKGERVITSQQSAHITVEPAEEVINFCANNYLGLANHPEVMEAAKAGIDRYGFGLASVRFICGTQDIHKDLERRISEFLGTDDTILYSSCFDANGGLFETLLGAEDAVISDSLNHASIIDGIRLCKAQRLRYANNDMTDLESKLVGLEARRTIIATDGVFSMDGVVADLGSICDLADCYGAMVMVDDCHAVGFMGEAGRGSHEHCGVMGRVDMITGTLGKALGGASGGYTSGRQEVIDWLRQRSRPYLFSNSVAPAICAASLKVLDLLEGSGELRDTLWDNTVYFRRGLKALGFDIVDGEHPIVPIMLGDARLAHDFAEACLARGIYVIGFSYPVVPKGKARIRTQMSAAHSREDLDKALGVFGEVGRELNILAEAR